MLVKKRDIANSDSHTFNKAARGSLFNAPRPLTSQEIEALREDKKQAHKEAVAILKTMTLPKI
ncbi:hypothetical protein ORJ04_00180 [Rheinheimera baltica]|uniref:Uncharacterized protein n=1 Tax=Rheinheimera baltica TaxID=67576 RepID=A0ABT9HTB4_9GAMM|nr:hypothetical protein [Rheinheimera baltica]MDP5134363.1 hypothetical protein [Rheinheimera baltica]